MRRAGFLLTSVLVGSVAVAQQPVTPTQPLQPVGGFQTPTQPQPQPPTQPAGALPVAAPAAPVAPDAATLQHLQGWERAMGNVKAFYAAATRSDQEVALKREAQFTVEMWLLKPNMARMDVTKVLPKGQQPTPADMKMYISTGRTLYLYDGAVRKRTQAALGTGGAGNNLLLDLMAGMTAKQITERFTVSTLKQDANFVYLEVKPVFRADKEEFEKLVLVLCGPQFQDRAYIPRRIQFTREGGASTETWDFPDPKVNPKGIAEATFAPIDLPKGWTDEKLDLPKAPGGAAGPGGPAPPPGASPRVPAPGGGR
jgi:TIGR03009 family protein